VVIGHGWLGLGSPNFEKTIEESSRGAGQKRNGDTWNPSEEIRGAGVRRVSAGKSGNVKSEKEDDCPNSQR